MKKSKSILWGGLLSLCLCLVAGGVQAGAVICYHKDYPGDLQFSFTAYVDDAHDADLSKIDAEYRCDSATLSETATANPEDYITFESLAVEAGIPYEIVSQKMREWGIDSSASDETRLFDASDV